jgi:uncharacterized protein (TIGR03000 family)
VPGVFGNGDLVRQWQAVPSPGIPFAAVGIYATPHRVITMNSFPVIEGVPAAANGQPRPDPTKPGGSLILSVKVPQPTAEVFVDGTKTRQTGTDRIFATPVVQAGKDCKYQVTARWVERGVTYEMTKVASGTPGEVVRVDFTAP